MSSRKRIKSDNSNNDIGSKIVVSLADAAASAVDKSRGEGCGDGFGCGCSGCGGIGGGNCCSGGNGDGGADLQISYFLINYKHELKFINILY